MIPNLQNQEKLSSPWAPPAAFLPSPVGALGWVETALSHIFLPPSIFWRSAGSPSCREKHPGQLGSTGNRGDVYRYFCARNEAKLT